MKYGAPVKIREEEILFPLEEAQQMLNEPLQTFLNRFTNYSTPDINLLHLQTITSVFSKLGYTLEINLPPIERPGLSDRSLFAYLQITEPLPSIKIIVLNLEEFNDLVSKVVYQQLAAFNRFFRPQPMSVEELRNAAHMVVCDPTGFLSYKEQTSASATSSSLFPSTSMPGQEALITAFQAAFLAMRSVGPPAPTSQQAATSETPRSGEFQKPMFTETNSSLALGAKSEMDVITSDIGADVVEGVAAETPMLEPEPDKQRELQTPVLPIDTSTTKKPESREKKADQKKSGTKRASDGGCHPKTRNPLHQRRTRV